MLKCVCPTRSSLSSCCRVLLWSLTDETTVAALSNCPCLSELCLSIESVRLIDVISSLPVCPCCPWTLTLLTLWRMWRRLWFCGTERRLLVNAEGKFSTVTQQFWVQPAVCSEDVFWKTKSFCGRGGREQGSDFLLEEPTSDETDCVCERDADRFGNESFLIQWILTFTWGPTRFLISWETFYDDENGWTDI